MSHDPKLRRELLRSISQESLNEGIRSIPIEAIVTTGLQAIGLITGAGPLTALLAGMGVGAVTGLSQRAIDHWCGRWFSREGGTAFSGDIAPLLSQAFAAAAGALEAVWQKDPAYLKLRSRDPEEAARTLETLHGLRHGAAGFLASSEQLGTAIQSDEWVPVRPDTEAEARQMLLEAIKSYLYGYDEEFVGFVEAHLPDEWLLRFGEALKADNPEGNRAWRAYQKLWQESLLDSVEQSGQGGAETVETLRWLKQWAQRLDATPVAQRDPTGEAALDAALAPVRKRLDEIKALTEETLRNTQEIKGSVAEISIGVKDVRGGLEQLSADVRERPLVTIGPGAHVTQVYDEQAYRVSGLPNPYLGLCSFTYADRDSYAGRASTVAATVRFLTTPGAQQSLLFITGASGSGKSSFAQAGLLPALEAYYAQRGLGARHAVFRPSRRPLAALADALMQLGLPAQRLLGDPQAGIGGPAAFNGFLHDTTPAQQVNLLVIDQFEELFSQSDPEEREAIFAILMGIAPFAEVRTCVLATMRSDYLADLFEVRGLYDIAKRGTDLRAMTADELKEAIQRPLQAAHPTGDKRWEPALVDKLARDASADAAYLPLLQVTLEEIWAGGSLTLDRYGTLTDAIKERAEAVYAYTAAVTARQAETVYAYADYAGARQQPRTPAEQAAIMSILLDLVDVSLDDDTRRDVRRQRTKLELAAGDPNRARLIDELADARLLSVSLEARTEAGVEKQQEMVDIIHETLIRNWDRLQAVIEEKRNELQQRVRFEQAVREWQSNNMGDEYLLSGVRLAEARALDRRSDIALRDADARELLRRSVAKQEAEQQRALEEQKRRADEAARRARVLRGLLVLAGLFLLVAVSAAVFAFVQQGRAQQESDARATAVVEANGQRNAAQQEAAARATAQADTERQLLISKAQALAAGSVAQGARDPELSLLLAMQAISTTLQVGRPPVPQAVDALHQALGQPLPLLVLRDQSSTEVNSAEYSPDGRFIVTGQGGGAARIWDAGTGQLVRALIGNSTRITDAVWSHDGRFIATSATDGTATLWDVSSGQVLHSLAVGANFVNGVAYSPDGRFIATAESDGTAEMWDTASGQQLHILGTLGTAAVSVAYSPDSRFLITGDDKGNAEIWDAATGQAVRTLDGHNKSLHKATYSPDSLRIATASDDGTAKVWDAATGKELYTLRYSDDQPVFDVTFSPNSRLIAAIGTVGTAIWDASNGQELRVLSQEYTGIGIAYSPDGRFLLTASKPVMVWDAVSGSELPTLLGHTDIVNAAAYSPDGRFIATAGQDGTARIWDAASGNGVLTIKAHNGFVHSVAWSPDGRSIATAGEDETARIWDAATGRQLQSFSIHNDAAAKSFAVFSVAYSPDGRFLVAGSADGNARVWDVSSGQKLLTLCCDKDAIFGAAYSPDGHLIATAGLSGSVKIWDAATGRELRTLQTSLLSAFETVSWSPDGRYVAGAGTGDSTAIWDAGSGQYLRVLQDSVGVWDAAYSPDGALIVAACTDGTAKVWDATSGQLLFRLAGHTKFVKTAAWSADGHRIVTASYDGTARQYVAATADLMRLAASRAYRDLSTFERATYLGGELPTAIPAPLLTPLPVPFPTP
ncbi:MAG: eIF2A-related protein [Chloroflexia bacterium]